MKKNLFIAIAALGVLAVASCNKELENEKEVGNTISVVVTPGIDKAYLTDEADFYFAAGDVVYFVSDDLTTVPSATVEEDAQEPELSFTIPGSSDVTGFFSNVNMKENVLDFTADQTILDAARTDLYVASLNQTIAAGAKSLVVEVGVVGTTLNFLPYSKTYAGEKVLSVSVSSEESFTGTATYNPVNGSCTVQKTASSVVANVTDEDAVVATDVQIVCGVKVPDCTIVKPCYTVVTDKATYTFQSAQEHNANRNHLPHTRIFVTQLAICKYINNYRDHQIQSNRYKNEPSFAIPE